MSKPFLYSAASRQEILAAQVSIACAVTIFIISFVVGVISDSVAMLLDAGAGLVMLLMAFLVRIIVKKVANPPDHRYNFGYEKYEPLTITLQNLAIIFTCLIGIAFAVQDIIHPEEVVRYGFPVAATLVSGIIALLLAAYLRKIFKHGSSSMFKTASFHWFMDATISFGMCVGFLFGLVLHKLGYLKISSQVDPVMAIVLAFIFMGVPLKDIAANVLELVDVVPGKDIHDKIKKVAEKHKKGIFGIHRMRVRKAGKKTFLDIGFIVPAGLTIKEAQKVAESFEHDLADEIPNSDAVVYFKHQDKHG